MRSPTGVSHPPGVLRDVGLTVGIEKSVWVYVARLPVRREQLGNLELFSDVILVPFQCTMSRAINMRKQTSSKNEILTLALELLVLIARDKDPH